MLFDLRLFNLMLFDQMLINLMLFNLMLFDLMLFDLTFFWFNVIRPIAILWQTLSLTSNIVQTRYTTTGCHVYCPIFFGSSFRRNFFFNKKRKNSIRIFFEPVPFARMEPSRTNLFPCNCQTSWLQQCYYFFLTFCCSVQFKKNFQSYNYYFFSLISWL
jgi:hypothetical protein